MTKKKAATTEQIVPAINEETELAKLTVEDRIRRGEEIIQGAINELKEKRKDLERQIENVDKMLAKYGSPVSRPSNGSTSSPTSGGRIRSADLESAVNFVLQGGVKLTHAQIKESQPVVELYKQVNKEVPNLFIQLDKLVEEKKLIKEGERKNATYRLAPTK